MPEYVKNTLGEAETGYIRKERLESRLLAIFKQPIMVQHISERFVFYAPRLVTQDEIDDLREVERLEAGDYDAILPHLRYPTFLTRPEQSNIYVYDSGSSIEHHVFTNSDMFEGHILTRPKPETRIVSICSQNSMKPLGITYTAMRNLINHYSIGPAFFDLLLAFGDKPQSSGAGHGGMTVTHRGDGSYDIQYLFTYAEDHRTNGRVLWTIRQICVFHRYDASGSGNLWILLHARPCSKVQQHLEAAIREQRDELFSDWFALHSVVLSSYLGNWRWCIGKLGEEVEKSVDTALTFDPADTEDNKRNLISLLKPQYLGDKLLPLSSRLGVALDIVQKLKNVNTNIYSRRLTSDTSSKHAADELEYYTTVLQGYLGSISVLEKKVQGVSDLLAVSLNVNYQAVAVEINNKMLKLTDAAFDDNATVKVVTLVTLIYLPASFVSTLLGMNLFEFDGGNGRGFTISGQFWIFVVIAVPLTLLTLAAWYLIIRRRSRLRAKSKDHDMEKAQ
ncbi:uncharacterized protein ATNIH1004_000108 [Aspergillus tanneri]|uniref:CorA-like transporter domain-containing protein n=1 Tax=Aspergillus tanneri TaxID=1220188 RepID=A0A5M9N0T4_9EURO|nr:uncharacterized protein ATNIH1004_000108 [Aspergillus tanneri]KAA8651230.1 hypothetical protein ATNIH1004_000108 [Aspergillus tanneri]